MSRTQTAAKPRPRRRPGSPSGSRRPLGRRRGGEVRRGAARLFRGGRPGVATARRPVATPGRVPLPPPGGRWAERKVLVPAGSRLSLAARLPPTPAPPRPTAEPARRPLVAPGRAGWRGPVGRPAWVEPTAPAARPGRAVVLPPEEPVRPGWCGPVGRPAWVAPMASTARPGRAVVLPPEEPVRPGWRDPAGRGEAGGEVVGGWRRRAAPGGDILAGRAERFAAGCGAARFDGGGVTGHRPGPEWTRGGWWLAR